MKEKITEAIDRYAEFCECNGLVYQQPSLEDTTVTKKKVILRNLNGVLARYDVEKDEIVV
jgi:hypothetical protein